MSERHESGNGRNRDAADRREYDSGDDRRRYGPGSRFARTTVRWALVLVGFALLLFALGQAFGVPLLGLVVDGLMTQTGRWLVVAFAALLLIAAATRMRRRRP